MTGYLDEYGAREARREKIRKSLVISFVALVALVAVGGTLFFIFHNYREEHQVKELFNHLAQRDYKAAYVFFGCTDAKPCRGYPLDKFMEDWGPGSGRNDTSNFRISKSRSCGSGVILTVDFGRNRQEKLWVERNDMTISFSPFPGRPLPPLWPFQVC